MDSLSLLKALVEVDSSVTEAANQLIDYAFAFLQSRGIQGQVLENEAIRVMSPQLEKVKEPWFSMVIWMWFLESLTSLSPMKRTENSMDVEQPT